METEYHHNDCRNFAPLDVIKGICHLSKQVVPADEPNCDAFDKMPKCRHCLHYTSADKEFTGTCGAVPTKPMTYPDLCGLQCEHFQWIPSPT